MASRKEYEMLFRLNAQLGGSYNSSFSSAQKSIIAMQKEIEALSKRQSDISSYQKQQAALEANRKKLENLQQQYNNIQREMNETGQYSADLQNKLLAKQMQIDKTSASINAQTERLTQMGSALRSAGVNTDDLTKESAELGQQIDVLQAKQEEAADGAEDFGSTASEAFGAIQQAIASAGIVRALEEIYEGLWDCADASMVFESTMTGVDKTTELTEEELAAMGAEFKELSSKEIPATTDELGEIAETAGQLGIVKDSLLDFTEIMAMLGTATNMTSSEAATMLAQFASITGMNPSFYMNLGSTVVALGNNYATTERNIADMSQTIAAAGSIADMSEADIVGIAAAVTSLGISAQNGGTQMTKLISDINSAVSSGEGLEDWARAAGMEAEDFADAWRDDAAGALDIFIRGLNDTYEAGGDVYGVLRDLGITETRMVTMVTSLAKSGDRLTSTLNTSNTAWAENTALTTEAEKRYATTQSQLTLMQNAYNNLKIAIGDNYNPVLQKLYELGADVLGDMTKFVEQNPALVKAITVFVGVLGTAVVGLAVYTLAVKVATAFSAAFATTAGVALGPILAVVAGVAALAAVFVAVTEASKDQLDELWELTAASREQYNELQELNDEYDRTVDVYGETSYEAQQLQWKIEDLNEEYESGKQTLEEYKAAHQELMDNYEEMSSSHAEANEKINTEQRSVLALIAKLEELTSTTDGAAKNQQAILAIIDALNEAVPDLALSYDDVIKNSGGVVESLQNIAKARAAQMLLEEQWSEYVDRVGQQDALKAAKEAAEYNAQIAQTEFDIAKKALDEAHDLYNFASDSQFTFMATDKEGAAYDAAKEHLDEYNSKLAEATTNYDENEAKLTELEEAFNSYQEAQEEALKNGENIGEVITDVTDRIAELAAAYDEAYNSALDSVQGQYDIWDKAEKVTTTSIDKINSRIEGQAEYWQNYNANLASLSDRAGDIEGLADVIASFADGSKESVNAVAGMATASDEDLTAMVQNWQALQQEQETTAGKLAEFETDFAASMDALQQELESTIGEMNLSEDAAQSGRNTIQGFIDGAEDMTDDVQRAYGRIAAAALDAIDRRMDMHSPSRAMEYRAELSWIGFIRETEAMAPEVAAAMANTAGAGTDAVTAEEMRFVALASGFMDKSNGAVSAEHGGGEVYIVISVSPEYNISGTENAAGIEAILRERDADLRDLILDVLEDAGIDSARRAYQ